MTSSNAQSKKDAVKNEELEDPMNCAIKKIKELNALFPHKKPEEDM